MLVTSLIVNLMDKASIVTLMVQFTKVILLMETSVAMAPKPWRMEILTKACLVTINLKVKAYINGLLVQYMTAKYFKPSVSVKLAYQ